MAELHLYVRSAGTAQLMFIPSTSYNRPVNLREWNLAVLSAHQSITFCPESVCLLVTSSAAGGSPQLVQWA
jgi:hypothetical protein